MTSARDAPEGNSPRLTGRGLGVLANWIGLGIRGRLGMSGGWGPWALSEATQLAPRAGGGLSTREPHARPVRLGSTCEPAPRMRYKLRSSAKQATPALKAPPGPSDVGSESDGSPSQCSAPKKPRVVRRRKVNHHKHVSEAPLPAVPASCSNVQITDLPQEVVLHIGSYLDSVSLLAIFQTNQWFNHMFANCNPYWKLICAREELANYHCLLSDEEDEDSGSRPSTAHLPPLKVGWSGRPMRVSPNREYPYWRRVFLKGLQMRRNIWQSNYEGWRIYANANVPVTKLTPDLDLNRVKTRMGNFPKLSENDDLKIDWDDKYLVVFHFFRGEGESCAIQLWDIAEEPKFRYQVSKGLECITDKVSVVQDHVVIVPSWPLEAQAVIMTLDIKNQMSEVGQFIFSSEEKRSALDDQWEHTQLRVIKNEAMVVCRCPNWHLVVVDLPSCNPTFEVDLPEIQTTYDCQQIRSYKQTAMILFSRKGNDFANILVTVDVSGKDTKVRSIHHCMDVADVALFTDPEEIYIMKRNGDVVMFDANLKTETIKIANEEPSPSMMIPIVPGDEARVNQNTNEYQLFVNRKEQICVMQSASEVLQGRHIKVYTYSEHKLYTINLDLCRFGMSRDESICIYTNGAFLAAADSKKFTMFNVKTGQFLGSIQIPVHLERTKGKEEKDCMFEQTGLSLFIFDEDKLIAVHDYERSFPAVLDIYKFW
eukprot:snap_masked-scaffold58_size443543-processed-gene-2.4 protein:Tk00696 transcript:snap_masked-scaffold58_size443543-processed-gene-2.4-mRNA-1 annotation:"probable e3 ubiquitin ligase complex scf subunit sconb-like"